MADTSTLNVGDRDAERGRLWTRFEPKLREHLKSEELCLFPLVARAHRSEVDELRNEHRRIRGALGVLGLRVELHALRKASSGELIDSLRQHANLEAHFLYAWIE